MCIAVLDATIGYGEVGAGYNYRAGVADERVRVARLGGRVGCGVWGELLWKGWRDGKEWGIRR